MPPSTRSGGGGVGDPAPPLKVNSLTRKTPARKPVKKTEKKKSAAAVSVPAPCTLLEMPPEIRNRIYSHCKEMPFSAPPLRKRKKTVRPSGRPSGRTFFSFSQTCRQIRSEYRPLWLTESSVALDHEDLADYLATFHSFPGTENLDVNHAPKTMVILWDHEKEDYKSGNLFIDLKPLLNLRTTCERFSVSFKSRRIYERDFAHEECETCNRCINCEGRCELFDWRGMLREYSESEDADYDSSDLDEMFDIWDSCSHEGPLDVVARDFIADYSYLEGLNGFLRSNNKAWIESIKGDLDHERMKVECTMGDICKIAVIYIRFDKNHEPPVFRREELRFAACQYLTDVGMIDLDCRLELNFVVGVGSGGTIKHSPGCRTVQRYDQMGFCGLTYEEPAGIVRPAKTGEGD